MLSGIASTLLVPETMGRSLEDISGEDQDNFVQLTDAQKQRQRELQASHAHGNTATGSNL
jgi:hypothetical protein